MLDPPIPANGRVWFEPGREVVEDVRYTVALAMAGARFVSSESEELGLLFRQHTGPRYSTRPIASFARGCAENAVWAQEYWEQHGGLTPARRAALSEAYAFAARQLASVDRESFERAAARGTALGAEFTRHLPARAAVAVPDRRLHAGGVDRVRVASRAAADGGETTSDRRRASESRARSVRLLPGRRGRAPRSMSRELARDLRAHGVESVVAAPADALRCRVATSTTAPPSIASHVDPIRGASRTCTAKATTAAARAIGGHSRRRRRGRAAPARVHARGVASCGSGGASDTAWRSCSRTTRRRRAACAARSCATAHEPCDGALIAQRCAACLLESRGVPAAVRDGAVARASGVRLRRSRPLACAAPG